MENSAFWSQVECQTPREFPTAGGKWESDDSRLPPALAESEPDVAGLVERVDLYRSAAVRGLDLAQRAEMGQFPTSPAVARFMASLFTELPLDVSLLDAGAGVGTLTAAFVEEMCRRAVPPRRITAIGYEIDTVLTPYLRLSMQGCEELCRQHGIDFIGQVNEEDFVVEGVAQLRGDLFSPQRSRYTAVILNPPYHKIRSDSHYRGLLREIGVETSNLYTGFLAIAIGLLEAGGQLVAITPRSFCNGPYFRPFRQLLLGQMALQHIHVFEARNEAFGADEVLQENVIFHAVKQGTRKWVTVSHTHSVGDDTLALREVAYDQVIHPDDPLVTIHISTSEMDTLVRERLASFQYSLDDIGIGVSTGRVVGFRARDYLRCAQSPDTVPLLHPGHLVQGRVQWPNSKIRKPEAIINSAVTAHLLLPSAPYVLVKRFSSKEEPRRVMAAVLEPADIPAPLLGLENHLNYFHINQGGLPSDVARGLALYLNSTLVDAYFRQFSGHTQVNATDLRMLPYPSREFLVQLGRHMDESSPTQMEIDALLEEEMRSMVDIQSPDPVAAKRKVAEALAALKDLGLPRGQLNERSALTLLALLGLQPNTAWSAATNPRMGITPIMDFCRDHYGTHYAANTRETFRRQTMHQFVDASLVVPNPDNPDRPINSPKWCYQIEPSALRLLKSYGTSDWQEGLAAWQRSANSLKQRYARERSMNRVPLQLADGQELYLTPGGHSRLIRAVIEEFAPRFVPNGQIIYVGDTGAKWAYFDRDTLEHLGVTLDEHGKMPDVVLYLRERDWLILVEAVTSHGPVDAKRRNELARLFSGARPGLVYVTAFLTRSDMVRYLGEISWATEVWIAESEAHLIHFNGERFLGPYED